MITLMNPEKGDGGGPAPFDGAYYRDVFKVDSLRRWSVPWWSNRYYARLAGRLLGRSGGGRLIDVGCGQGHMLGQLDPGVDAWGIEVSEYAVSRCAILAPRAKVIHGNIEDGIPGGVPVAGFDVVVARYLFEHLVDPGAAIARCASLLRPGGHILFSVPNTSSPGRRLKGEQWFALLDKTHRSLLDPPAWKRLVEGAGLATRKIFSDGLWDVPYVRGIPNILQYAVFSLPTILAVLFVSTAIPLSWGENLIGIAQRPIVELPTGEQP
jgi:SAM-dependent methyltransferase